MIEVAMLAQEVTQTSQAVTFAVVVAVIGAGVTILSLVLNNRNKDAAEERANKQIIAMDEARKKEKEADRQAEIEKEKRDYARQDLVAERLLESTNATAAATRHVVALSQRNSEKLDVVEHLGNSQLTAQHESRLTTLRMNLVLAKEVAELQRALDREPTPAMLATLVATEKDIADLENVIMERKVVDAQAVAMLAQPTIDREAAELQVEAAATQQVAAGRQEAAAATISGALVGEKSLPPPPPPPPNQQ